jgi:hypothetical protein
MSQRAVFFLSSIAGLGLFAAIAHIQLDSRAFTSRSGAALERNVDSETPVRPVELPAVVTLPDDASVLTLPTLEVFGRPQTARPPAAKGLSTPAGSPLDHEATAPCSEWRDISPRHVNDGVPSGAVKVRNLC